MDAGAGQLDTRDQIKEFIHLLKQRLYFSLPKGVDQLAYLVKLNLGHFFSHFYH